ncbi:hypothetical protein [Neobacillus notoginsengisoli]|nr:hypothetical protein [Neobacillus notoginsengisoli]
MSKNNPNRRSTAAKALYIINITLLLVFGLILWLLHKHPQIMKPFSKFF